MKKLVMVFLALVLVLSLASPMALAAVPDDLQAMAPGSLILVKVGANIFVLPPNVAPDANGLIAGVQINEAMIASGGYATYDMLPSAEFKAYAWNISVGVDALDGDDGTKQQYVLGSAGGYLEVAGGKLAKVAAIDAPWCVAYNWAMDTAEYYIGEIADMGAEDTGVRFATDYATSTDAVGPFTGLGYKDGSFGVFNLKEAGVSAATLWQLDSGLYPSVKGVAAQNDKSAIRFGASLSAEDLKTFAATANDAGAEYAFGFYTATAANFNNGANYAALKKTYISPFTVATGVADPLMWNALYAAAATGTAIKTRLYNDYPAAGAARGLGDLNIYSADNASVVYALIASNMTTIAGTDLVFVPFVEMFELEFADFVEGVPTFNTVTKKLFGDMKLTSVNGVLGGTAPTTVAAFSGAEMDAYENPVDDDWDNGVW